MYGCKDKLCKLAEIKLVEANRPKMLSAYNYKLCFEAERKMIEKGYYKLLKVYRFELDIENQMLLAQSGRPKLIRAYRFHFCDEAKKKLPENKMKTRHAKKTTMSTCVVASA